MASVWKKALVYLGLFEEEDDLEPLPDVNEPPQLDTVRPIRPDVASTLRPSSTTTQPLATQPASIALSVFAFVPAVTPL